MHIHVLSDNVPNVADPDRDLEGIVGPSVVLPNKRTESIL